MMLEVRDGRSTTMCYPTSSTIHLLWSSAGTRPSSRSYHFSSSLPRSSNCSVKSFQPFPLVSFARLSWFSDDFWIGLGHENEHHLLELAEVFWCWRRRDWVGRGGVGVGIRGRWRDERDDAWKKRAKDGEEKRGEEVNSNVDRVVGRGGEFARGGWARG